MTADHAAARATAPASSDELAERCNRHADAILRAGGSRLHNYETRSKSAILMAVMDCIEEATRDGARRTYHASKENGDVTHRTQG